MRQLEGPFEAILAVLEGMADNGVLNQETVAAIRARLRQRGDVLKRQSREAEGCHLLTLADALVLVQDQLKDKSPE